MTTLTEGKHEGEFIGELAMGIGYHVEEITLDTGNLVAGAVLGAIETGTPTATAGTPVSGVGGTVGNGTVSAVTADAGVPAGNWALECTATGATGKFKVIKPDGTLDGILTIGTAYNGGLNLTVSDGANDWLVGDIIPVAVAYSGSQTAKKFVEHNPTATDGSQVAAAILFKATNATSADVLTTAVVRGPATVNINDLTWKSGATAAQIAKGRADLLALGIKTA
jgi:hypothetical protein